MKNQDVNSFWEWLKKEKYSVSVTLFAAIIPSIITYVISLISIFQEEAQNSEKGNLCLCRKAFILSDIDVSNIIQFFFIFITLFVLVYYQSRTRKDLVQCKAYIIKYIKKNTNRKLKNTSDAESAYELVKTSVIQFYRFWIIVWLLWMAYYLGGSIFSLAHSQTIQDGWNIYGKIFDFLNSTALLLIYIVLENITVHTEIRRNEDKSITWYGILFWFVIFVLFLVLLIFEAIDVGDIYGRINAILVSSFAAMVFVMVLGKLNSHYLQVPRVFMMVMYFDAIIQMYNPFIEIKVEYESLTFIQYIQYVVPVVTLVGKVCLMLTLCWMVNKKRLIFFIIHRSAAMEITQNLMSELDQEPVEF